MKILMITTGGTIASADSGGGLAPKLLAGELLAGIGGKADIDTAELFSLDSTNITPEHWVRLAALIRDRWAEYGGFVITHGTDTMAYGAAALSLLIQHADKPVIFTGSQLPLNAPESDAPRNLADALKCAASGAGGVWVCFCGRVISGRAARKVHTTAPDAFRGFMPTDECTVEAFCRERPESGCSSGGAVFYNRLDEKAAVLKLTPGISSELVREIGTGVNALLLEGFGSGGVPAALCGVIRELTACGVRVIVTTQVFGGGCNLEVYEVGKSALAAGAIPANGMTTEYAVMRAMWALAYSYTAEDFRELFLEKRS